MRSWKLILGSLVIASCTSAAASRSAAFDEKQINQMLKDAVDAQISFVKDAGGTVTHLILHQNGRDQKATKIK